MDHSCKNRERTRQPSSLTRLFIYANIFFTYYATDYYCSATVQSTTVKTGYYYNRGNPPGERVVYPELKQNVISINQTNNNILYNESSIRNNLKITVDVISSARKNTQSSSIGVHSNLSEIHSGLGLHRTNHTNNENQFWDKYKYNEKVTQNNSHTNCLRNVRKDLRLTGDSRTKRCATNNRKLLVRKKDPVLREQASNIVLNDPNTSCCQMINQLLSEAFKLKNNCKCSSNDIPAQDNNYNIALPVVNESNNNQVQSTENNIYDSGRNISMSTDRLSHYNNLKSNLIEISDHPFVEHNMNNGDTGFQIEEQTDNLNKTMMERSAFQIDKPLRENLDHYLQPIQNKYKAMNDVQQTYNEEGKPGGTNYKTNMIDYLYSLKENEERKEESTLEHHENQSPIINKVNSKTKTVMEETTFKAVINDNIKYVFKESSRSNTTETKTMRKEFIDPTNELQTIGDGTNYQNEVPVVAPSGGENLSKNIGHDITDDDKQKIEDPENNVSTDNIHSPDNNTFVEGIKRQPENAEPKTRMFDEVESDKENHVGNDEGEQENEQVQSDVTNNDNVDTKDLQINLESSLNSPLKDKKEQIPSVSKETAQDETLHEPKNDRVADNDSARDINETKHLITANEEVNNGDNQQTGKEYHDEGKNINLQNSSNTTELNLLKSQNDTLITSDDAFVTPSFVESKREKANLFTDSPDGDYYYSTMYEFLSNMPIEESKSDEKINQSTNKMLSDINMSKGCKNYYARNNQLNHTSQSLSPFDIILCTSTESPFLENEVVTSKQINTPEENNMNNSSNDVTTDFIAQGNGNKINQDLSVENFKPENVTQFPVGIGYTGEDNEGHEKENIFSAEHLPDDSIKETKPTKEDMGIPFSATDAEINITDLVNKNTEILEINDLNHNKNTEIVNYFTTHSMLKNLSKSQNYPEKSQSINPLATSYGNTQINGNENLYANKQEIKNEFKSVSDEFKTKIGIDNFSSTDAVSLENKNLQTTLPNELKFEYAHDKVDNKINLSDELVEKYDQKTDNDNEEVLTTNIPAHQLTTPMPTLIGNTNSNEKNMNTKENKDENQVVAIDNTTDNNYKVATNLKKNPDSLAYTKSNEFKNYFNEIDDKPLTTTLVTGYTENVLPENDVLGMDTDTSKMNSEDDSKEDNKNLPKENNENISITEGSHKLPLATILAMTPNINESVFTNNDGTLSDSSPLAESLHYFNKNTLTTKQTYFDYTKQPKEYSFSNIFESTTIPVSSKESNQIGIKQNEPNELPNSIDHDSRSANKYDSNELDFGQTVPDKLSKSIDRETDSTQEYKSNEVGFGQTVSDTISSSFARDKVGQTVPDKMSSSFGHNEVGFGQTVPDKLSKSIDRDEVGQTVPDTMSSSFGHYEVGSNDINSGQIVPDKLSKSIGHDSESTNKYKSNELGFGQTIPDTISSSLAHYEVGFGQTRLDTMSSSSDHDSASGNKYENNEIGSKQIEPYKLSDSLGHDLGSENNNVESDNNGNQYNEMTHDTSTTSSQPERSTAFYKDKMYKTGEQSVEAIRNEINIQENNRLPENSTQGNIHESNSVQYDLHTTTNDNGDMNLSPSVIPQALGAQSMSTSVTPMGNSEHNLMHDNKNIAGIMLPTGEDNLNSNHSEISGNVINDLSITVNTNEYTVLPYMNLKEAENNAQINSTESQNNTQFIRIVKNNVTQEQFINDNYTTTVNELEDNYKNSKYSTDTVIVKPQDVILKSANENNSNYVFENYNTEITFAPVYTGDKADTIGNDNYCESGTSHEISYTLDDASNYNDTETGIGKINDRKIFATESKDASDFEILNEVIGKGNRNGTVGTIEYDVSVTTPKVTKFNEVTDNEINVERKSENNEIIHSVQDINNAISNEYTNYDVINYTTEVDVGINHETNKVTLISQYTDPPISNVNADKTLEIDNINSNSTDNSDSLYNTNFYRDKTGTSPASENKYKAKLDKDFNRIDLFTDTEGSVARNQNTTNSVSKLNEITKEQTYSPKFGLTTPLQQQEVASFDDELMKEDLQSINSVRNLDNVSELTPTITITDFREENTKQNGFPAILRLPVWVIINNLSLIDSPNTRFYAESNGKKTELDLVRLNEPSQSLNSKYNELQNDKIKRITNNEKQIEQKPIKTLTPFQFNGGDRNNEYFNEFDKGNEIVIVPSLMPSNKTSDSFQRNESFYEMPKNYVNDSSVSGVLAQNYTALPKELFYNEGNRNINITKPNNPNWLSGEKDKINNVNQSRTIGSLINLEKNSLRKLKRTNLIHRQNNLYEPYNKNRLKFYKNVYNTLLHDKGKLFKRHHSVKLNSKLKNNMYSSHMKRSLQDRMSDILAKSNVNQYKEDIITKDQNVIDVIYTAIKKLKEIFE